METSWGYTRTMEMNVKKPTLSVSQFVEMVSELLAAVGDVIVEGEISDYKVIQNKWVVFQLKDDTSNVGCFIPAWSVHTALEDGMLVRVVGQPRLRNKGFFSFVLSRIEPAGEGALRRAFVLLKQKLEHEGIFATERKRPLPRFPEHIALITSRDAAAYSDFLKVLRARQGGLRISFLHTNVQGDAAAEQIVAALAYANTELKGLDAIVMVRGGGSLEDLQAFNDELVIRAVAASRTPTVVGIGHERDVSLAELAADVRASTPSNAAELLVRSREELLSTLATMQISLTAALRKSMSAKTERVAQLAAALRTHFAATQEKIRLRIQSLEMQSQRFRHKASIIRERVVAFHQQLLSLLHRTLNEQQQDLQSTIRLLESFSPQANLQRGYSITRTSSGSVITSMSAIKSDEQISTRVADGSFTSRIDKQSRSR